MLYKARFLFRPHVSYELIASVKLCKDFLKKTIAVVDHKYCCCAS